MFLLTICCSLGAAGAPAVLDKSQHSHLVALVLLSTPLLSTLFSLAGQRLFFTLEVAGLNRVQLGSGQAEGERVL